MTLPLDFANIRYTFLVTCISLCLYIVNTDYSPVNAYDVLTTPSPLKVSDDQVNAIAKELYCPVCENISLDVCPTEACSRWRELIRLKISQGWNKEEIKKYFAEQYGDRALAEPPLQGLNWLFYLFPIFIIAGGVIITLMKMKGMVQPYGSDIPKTQSATDDDKIIHEIEEEIHKRVS
jgi:cytochrome c-type biogenesis protein CcmH